MSRRSLPPSSRIFTRKKSAWSRFLGSSLLTFSLAVTAFGLGTAVYLERGPARAPQLAPAPVAALPSPPFRDPVAAEAAVPSRPIPASPAAPAAAPAPSAAALAAIEPMAGPAAAMAAPPRTAALAPAPAPETAALSAPSPSPHDKLRTPQRHYWVEYGAYVGASYARRLQQALAREGIRALVVTTHGLGGRRLLRVRSAPLPGFQAAREAAAQAGSALGIAPLVHRGDPAADAPGRRYWVQFGAFRRVAQAERLKRHLRRAGVASRVAFAKGTAGTRFYLVRSLPLASHAEAVALAAQGRPAARAAALIGETRHIAAHQPAIRAPPRPLAELR